MSRNDDTANDPGSACGPPLSSAAQETLAKWRKMIESGELSELPSIIAENAVFHSPVGLKPYAGREVVCLVLRTAATVFQGFEYCRELAADASAVLLFRAAVDGAELRGVHILRFDDAGQITDVEKMIRPSKVAVMLGDAIGAKAGDRIRELRDGTDN